MEIGTDNSSGASVTDRAPTFRHPEREPAEPIASTYKSDIADLSQVTSPFTQEESKMGWLCWQRQICISDGCSGPTFSFHLYINVYSLNKLVLQLLCNHRNKGSLGYATEYSWLISWVLPFLVCR